MHYDVLVKGGSVIDGTGSKRRRLDVGIIGDRVIAVEPQIEAEATVTIDATGMIVAPGFIDTHTHSDVMLLAEPLHEKGIRQGITTEVLAQDGLSYAPLSKENLDLYRRYLAGLNGNPNIDWDWSSVAEYRSKFDGTVAVNTVYQVPHGALRLETVGMFDRPLHGESLAKAKALLRQGFDEGAAGFSTGLSYYPCSWSDTDELVELCKIAAEYQRPYVVHLRTVFREPQTDYFKAAIDETLEIGRRSGVAVHFSHFRTSAVNAGKVDSLLEPIERAMADGVEITLETYPYPFGSGYALMYLPPWAHEGGPDEILSRLKDGGTRRRIKAEIETSPFPPFPDETYTNVGSPEHQWAVGLTFAEVGQRLGLDWLDALLYLMVESQLVVGMKGAPPTDAGVLAQLERDLLDLISRPNYMVGSDSIPVGENPHPRAYGTFPRFIRLAREYGYPSLETLINRMTAVPAYRFGLSDRGRLAPHMAADVVVFDPVNITDLATHAQPKQYATGVRDVIVNGELVLSNGQMTGKLPGRALSPETGGGR